MKYRMWVAGFDIRLVAGPDIRPMTGLDKIMVATSF